MKRFNKVFLGLLSVSLLMGGAAFALNCPTGSEVFLRYVNSSADTEIFCLDKSGNITAPEGALFIGEGIKLGEATASAPTDGASGTGSNFGLKVPFVNAGSATIPAGAVVIASHTATSILAPGVADALLSTTSWVGINESSLSAGATGYMTVAGYALVLSTGTVEINDLLVTTGTVAGRVGKIAPGAGVLEGSVVGKAMSVGAATGDTILIRVGN